MLIPSLCLKRQRGGRYWNLGVPLDRSWGLWLWHPIGKLPKITFLLPLFSCWWLSWVRSTRNQSARELLTQARLVGHPGPRAGWKRVEIEFGGPNMRYSASYGSNRVGFTWTPWMGSFEGGEIRKAYWASKNYVSLYSLLRRCWNQRFWTLCLMFYYSFLRLELIVLWPLVSYFIRESSKLNIWHFTYAWHLMPINNLASLIRTFLINIKVTF